MWQEMQAVDYLLEASTHTRFVRETLAAAQRVLPGQIDDVHQREINAIYEQAYQLGARIRAFELALRKEGATNERG